jgi:hypothetical protein
MIMALLLLISMNSMIAWKVLKVMLGRGNAIRP